MTQTQALRHKSALIEEKLELQQKKLREGGVDAWKGREHQQFAGRVSIAEVMETAAAWPPEIKFRRVTVA